MSSLIYSSKKNQVVLPPKVDVTKLHKMKKESLIKMEKLYDDFLEKNEQVLMLYNIIEDYLDIRDAITIHLQRILRQEELEFKKLGSTGIKETGYYDVMVPYLETSLQLTKQEVISGYVPGPSEPKEYKCGCVIMRYYCIQNHKKYKEKRYLKKYHYCSQHSKMVFQKEQLEKQLTKLKKDLSDAKKHINILDYEYYERWINGDSRYLSRYPWKQI